MHELVPEVPLRHGHAISIDMAYSATLANQRGLLSDAEHKRILNLFSRCGLSMDHPQFDEEILDKATQAILKTRDGKLRAAVPNPLGSCVFLNDVSQEDMASALHKHKEIMKNYPRNGAGLEAFVDASDTGYTVNNKAVENGANGTNGATIINDDAKTGMAKGGLGQNGNVDGVTGKPDHATNHASGPEGVDGPTGAKKENGAPVRELANGVNNA